RVKGGGVRYYTIQVEQDGVVLAAVDPLALGLRHEIALQLAKDLTTQLASLRSSRGEVCSKSVWPIFCDSSPAHTACPYSAGSVDRRPEAAQSSAPQKRAARVRARTAPYRHRSRATGRSPGRRAHPPVPASRRPVPEDEPARRRLLDLLGRQSLVLA